MMLELDHIFCMVGDLDQAASGLEREGWVLDGGSEQPVHGARNRRLVWPGEYLELVCIADPLRARADRLRLDRRADWASTGAGPVLVGMRGRIPHAFRDDFWLYEDLGPRIWVHRDNERAPDRPLVFVIETGEEDSEERGSRSSGAGPLGNRRSGVLCEVRVRGPSVALMPSCTGPPIVSSVGPHHVELIVGDGRDRPITQILSIRGRFPMGGTDRRFGAAITHGSAGRQRSVRGGHEVDGRWRARFRDGDPDAVRIVYRAYGSLVYAVAFRLLGDRGLCEEATQQTFLRAWQAAAEFDTSRELGPWLATIARRVAIDLYRREAIRAAGPLDAVAPDHPALRVQPTTDAVLDVWEVRRAVAALPAEQRDVVRLQHFDGLAHDEIAARLGVPVGTVKSRSFRAHQRLALELGHLRDGNLSPTPRRSRLQETQR